MGDRWANIHPDLLNEIAKQFYSYDDYIRLRLVCKEWKLKLPKIPNHKRNLWLVLPAVDETSETHSLEKKEIYHIILPEMQNTFIRGSCYGWLIIVMITEGTIRIMNPFTKAHFDLPPISTFPDVIDVHGDEYILRGFRDDSTYPLDCIGLHKVEVWKVVISSPPDNDNDDFMAVAIYGECCRLALYKHNDSRWTDIPTSEVDVDFQDVIFFQEKIYAINMDAQLYEFDTKTEPLPIEAISEAAPPSDILNKYSNASMNKYLIGCDNGSLLMLVRHLDLKDELKDGLRGEYSYYQTYKFDIFVLNKNSKEWSRIYSLGNHLLMIGYNASIRMLPHTFSNCKENHIYYTDNQVELHPSDIATVHDIGILNLEDTSTKNLLSNVKFFCPPVWLLPY